MPVLMDGGIRRGTDVLKAIATGATACMIGRPYVYGLTTAGEAGVSRVLEMFQTEIARNLALVGAPTLANLDRSLLRHRHPA